MRASGGIAMSFKRGIRFKFAVFIGAFIVALMAVDAL